MPSDTGPKPAPVSAGGAPSIGAILEKSAHLFNEQGYFDTRLSDVADRLGLAKTTISYHFRSKEALLQQLYERACEMAESDLAATLDAPTGRDALVAWLNRTVRRQTDGLVGNAPPLAIIADLNALADPERAGFAKRLKSQFAGLASILERGRRDGSLAVESIDATAFFLFSIHNWLGTWLTQIPPNDYPEARAGFVDLILHGLAADRAWQHGPSHHMQTTEAVSAIFDRESRSRLKREAFLRAGTRALNEFGYRNLSLLSVASELGVSRSAFYYYINDKETLLRLSVERSLALIDKAQDQAGAGMAPDSISRVSAALRSVFDGHFSGLDPLIRLSLFSALPSAQQAVARASYRRIAAGFGQMVADGMVDGSVRGLPVNAIEHIIMGALFAASRRQLRLASLDAAWPADTHAPLLVAPAYFEPLFTGVSTETR